MMKNLKKLTSLTAATLALAVFAAPLAKADCTSRLRKTVDKEDMTSYKLGSPIRSEIFALLLFGASPIGPILSDAILAQALGIGGLGFDASSRNETRKLLSEAHDGSGPNLDKFYNEVAKVRPDLSKEKVIQLLVESDEKEYICNPGYSSIGMVREFVKDGDLERAERGQFDSSQKAPGEIAATTYELPADRRARIGKVD